MTEMQEQEATPTFRARPAADDGRVTDHAIRLAFLGLFAWWSLQLVMPFLTIAIWSVILAVALHPVYRRLLRLFGGRGSLAAAVLTASVLGLVAGPIALLATNLVETLTGIAESIQEGRVRIPPPPPGLSDWPIIGEQLEGRWSLASENFPAALNQIWPEPRVTATAVVRRLSSMGGELALFLLAVLLSGFLYKPGPRIVEGARLFASRLVAPRGEAFVEMAGATIRSVSQGVIGLAVLESLVAGIILLVADVPAAGLIAFAILLLSLIQIGPAPVLVPLVIWVWTTNVAVPAAAITLAAVAILLADNLLKPFLIRRGLKTPMLVILAGVMGGTIGYGMVGLFLGPVVLAVFYELVVAWVRFEPAPGTTPGAPEA
jgi:predicted PurR-regulated permease PerM